MRTLYCCCRFSPADFPGFTLVSFFIWTAVVIDDTPIVDYTEYASVDVLQVEEKHKFCVGFALCFLKFSVFLHHSNDGVLSFYFPFTQTCFVTFHNSTVIKLRPCRSCHLSYYLCTVSINAVFFFYFPTLQSTVMNI